MPAVEYAVEVKKRGAPRLHIGHVEKVHLGDRMHRSTKTLDVYLSESVMFLSQPHTRSSSLSKAGQML